MISENQDKEEELKVEDQAVVSYVSSQQDLYSHATREMLNIIDRSNSSRKSTSYKEEKL